MIKLIANFLIIFLLFIPKISAIEDLALPKGPQVTDGEVTINNQILGTLNINQISSSATIEWNTFNVGSKASVYFNQPTNTSSIYNDVRNGRSIINGKIYANGKLFLHNPSGIYLGPYSAVQGQGIVLSTLNLLNKNSQTQEHFYASQSDANLETQGLIEAGYVTLISSSIKQLGTIKATGDVQLAASDEVYLKILPNSQLTVKVEPSEIQTALDNQGGIISSQGQVFLKSDITQSFVDQSINHSNLQATELVNDNGIFKLVSNSGNIKANNIQLSSGKRGATSNSGVLDASTDFDGGIISIEGNQISIQENSILNATGKNQGGKIKIGGEWQGQGSMIQAETTSIDKNTTINASSLGEGDGGTIVVWSDIKNPSSVTSVKGDLIASAINGQGGNIETSGYHLDISSVNINASSDQGADGLWLIDPVDFTIASSGGDMTGNALTTSLASASVTILSSGGSSGTEGDININDAVTWSANKLTLNANNNIYINADLLGSGTAQLDLLYGQGAVASGNTSDYSILKTSSGFSASVNLPDGNNFSTKLGSDGSTINYTVISSLASLSSNSGIYAIGSDINANSWSSNGTTNSVRDNFYGTLDGLGHTIDNLTLVGSSGQEVGFTGWLNNAGTLIRNLGLTNIDYTNTNTNRRTGGFIASCQSSCSSVKIINSYVHGTIDNSGGYIGGMIGQVATSSNSATVKDSFSDVTITNTSARTGGIVGSNLGTLSIINTFNSGDITGNNSAGGLVGYSNSSFLEIDTSYNTGNISNTNTGDSNVGGLVAQVLGSNANIHNSYNTGAISSAKGNTGSNGGAGGIVGHFNAGASSKIQYTYNTGAVVGGRKNIGGIVGVLRNSTVDQVYNTGAISGTQDLGGIVGYNLANGYVINAYNTGQIGVSGVSAAHVGGVVGRNDAYVQYAYGSGMVYGGGRKGAVIGVQVRGGYAKDIYGDNELTGISTHIYLGGTVTNANDFTTAQMKDLSNYSNFSGSLWSRFDSVNSGYPILTNNTTESIITFTATDLTKTYGESLDLSSFISNGWYSISEGTLASVFSVNPNLNLYDSNSLITDSTPNTGSYTITPSGGTANSDYLISYNSGTLTVNPKALTVSNITASNKTYNGNTSATIDVSSASYSGLISGDSISVASTGVFDNKNVGTGKTVTLTSSYSGDDISNYSITDQSSTTANIIAKALTVSGITASNKTYNGNTSATIDVSSASYSGLISGDSISVASTGVFDNKNVGTGKTVTLTSSYSGDDISNYSITDQSSTTANIIAKALTVSGITASNKTYNGNTSATIDVSSASYSGLISGDSISVASTGVFDNKNVGTGKTVTLTSSYSGDDISNYSITDQSSTTANIIAKALTVSGITASNKTYDGNAIAALSTASASYDGLISGDDLTVSASGAFSNKNVGTGKTVTLTSSYSGDDISNYSITDQSSTTANIIAKALTVSGITASNKTYNGNTSATIDVSSASYSGLISGDSISVASTGVFDNKNVGTGKTVTLTSSYSGDDISNYSITDQSSTTANIIAKALTVSGITASNKTYDGNAIAALSTASASYDGLISGDDLTVSASGAFSNKNVGTGKTVTLTSSYSGDDISNYSITDQSSTTANIIAKALTVSGITASNKTYNGNTSATIDVSSASYSGLISGDSISVASTGVFDNKNVGTGKTVTLTSSYSGDDISNYSITDQSSTTANIIAKALTVSGITASNKTYDGNAIAALSTASASYDGLISGDDLTVSASGAFSNKNVGTGKTVTLTSSYSGDDISNYSITDQSSTTANIIAKALTVSGITASNKTYDGNAIAALSTASASYDGLISGDDLTVSASGAFSNKNVGTGKTVTLTSSYSGDDISNYSITDQSSTTANIIAKALTVSGITASNKTYDGNAIAALSTASASYDGLISGDDLTVSASGAFSNKNVGTGKTVTLTSSYSGDDISNYSITDQSSTTANIVQLSSVTWTGDGDGDAWSTAANWTSSAIPDNNNVAAVVIPANASVEYDADNLGAVGSTITNSGTLTFTGSTDLTFANVISGTGSVVKSGTGSLTLSGANTFSGGMNYGSSTLIISNSFAATSFTSSGGNLSISPTLRTIDLTGPTTISSDITTTGTQRYRGNIIVASGSIASPVEFSSTNADIIFDGILKADATGKSRSMTFDAGTANLIFNDRIGYNFNSADFDPDLTADSFYKMIFNAGSITVKGDVMTFEEQVYNGPVIIGSNNNGVTRTLLSMDPAITFNSTVNDTIANTHNLIAKAVEVRRVGEVATTPVVTFASYVGNNISLASHQGLTGYQIIDEKFGNIDTSIDFGTVNAAPVITSSNNSSTAAAKAKKAASNAVKSVSPIRTTSGFTTNYGRSFN